MKYQILLSGKNNINIVKCLMKLLPRVLRVKFGLAAGDKEKKSHFIMHSRKYLGYLDKNIMYFSTNVLCLQKCVIEK